MISTANRVVRDRNGLVHVVLALPSLIQAGLIVVLGVTGDALGPVYLAAIPWAVIGVAVWFASRWWLVGVALIGLVAGAAAQVGISLNYIDHSPASGAARFALDAMGILQYVALLSLVVAILVGILEWRARRATA